MKKLILTSAVLASLGITGVASAAPLAHVTDPTPGGMLTGSYNKAGGGTGTQTGYVGIYSDGVVACNGSTTTLNGPEGSGQGFVWVGPGEAASHPATPAAITAAGAGSNSSSSGATSTGAPCKDNNTGS